MKYLINLQLFAEGEGGEGGSDGAAQTQTTDTNLSGNSRRSKGPQVLYGKQDATAAEQIAEPKADDIEAKKARYKELIEGEYKDQFTEHFQKTFNRRFGEFKNLETQVNKTNPILEALQQRYQTKNGTPEELLEALNNDDIYFERAAEDAGLTVEQLKHMRKIEAENQRYQRYQQVMDARKKADEVSRRWQSEAIELQKIYPNFSFQNALNNERFKDLLNPKNNLDLKTAYEVAFIDEIKNSVAQATAQKTEKKIVDNIRAKGSRPTENGVAAGNGVIIKDDPSKWTKKDRDNIEKRVLAGERIRL